MQNGERVQDIRPRVKLVEVERCYVMWKIWMIRARTASLMTSSALLSVGVNEESGVFTNVIFLAARNRILEATKTA